MVTPTQPPTASVIQSATAADPPSARPAASALPAGLDREPDAVPRRGGWVPGNRWDLLGDAVPDPLPTVSVVVAHYDQPAELARTLHALARQDYPAELVQMIVADDGSPEAPVVPAGVELVRQDDLGFRAAAVRNLGARAATGEVLCFLDADTTPEPDYLRRISRLPALLPEAVAVGRRRHADFSAVAVDVPVEQAGPAHELDEPAWLREAYERSRDLLDADDRSYRYVISAAVACTRWFFGIVGGFDESFDRYGGEDWEWAHRSWQHGGVLAHARDAVTWHDGPDWAGRDNADRARRANDQTLRLARMIPIDGSRGRGLEAAEPDVIVRLHGAHTEAATFVCVDSMLAAFPRARVLVDPATLDLFAGDGRVRPADEPADARVVLDLHRPVAVLGASADALADRIRSLGGGEEGELELRAADGTPLGWALSRRARLRRERWGTAEVFTTGILALEEAFALRAEPQVEAYLGGWAGPQQLV